LTLNRIIQSIISHLFITSQFLLAVCSFFLVLHDLLQSQLYFLDGLSRRLMGVCRHIELEKSVWKLFKNSKVCNTLFLLTSLINHLLEFLDKSTTVVMEGVFATHKNLCPWVLLQRLSFCPYGRHKCIRLWIYAPIFQVSSQAYFKESMGEDHVIKGMEQAGSVIVDVEVECRVNEDKAIGFGKIPFD
jgi:hypothetical protein